jgi:hypothetical protein
MSNRRKGRGMSRAGCFLLFVLILGLAADPAPAQAPVPPPVSTSSLTPDKMLAKEKAVEEHAQKRAACKSQAKEAGLGMMARRNFVRDCMAAR